MMKIFTLYNLRSNLVAFAVVLLALSLAVWLTQSVRLIEFVISGGAPLYLFFNLLVLTLPSFVLLALPIAFLISVLFVLNKMMQDNEFAVMRAAGVSGLRFSMPVLLLSLIVTILGYGLSLELAPRAQHHLIDLQKAIKNEFSAFFVREGVFVDMSDSLTVFVNEKNNQGELFGILIHDLKQPQRPATIMAQYGKLIQTPKGNRVLIYNGVRQEYNLLTKKLSELYFDQYNFDLEQYRNVVEARWQDPRERSLSDLRKPVDLNNQRDMENRGRFIVEFHKRLTVPIYVFSFTCMALYGLMNLQFQRRGYGRAILIILSVALLIRAVGFGVENLAAKKLKFLFAVYLVPLSPFIYILVSEFKQVSQNFRSKQNFGYRSTS